MRLLLLLLLPCCSLGQYFNIETEFLCTKLPAVRPGVIFSGGAFIKSEDERTFRLGAGMGVFMIRDGDNPYFPLFVEAGYYNKQKKISPYLNARIGYGFYNGSADFIGKDGYGKGGLFTSVALGAAIKVAGRFAVAPAIGFNGFQIREKRLGETVSASNGGVFTFGLNMLFAK